LHELTCGRIVFEDKALADEAVHAVEKSIAHHGNDDERELVPQQATENKKSEP
jgi:hypothetical protein